MSEADLAVMGSGPRSKVLKTVWSPEVRDRCPGTVIQTAPPRISRAGTRGAGQPRNACSRPVAAPLTRALPPPPLSRALIRTGGCAAVLAGGGARGAELVVHRAGRARCYFPRRSESSRRRSRHKMRMCPHEPCSPTRPALFPLLHRLCPMPHGPLAPLLNAPLPQTAMPQCPVAIAGDERRHVHTDPLPGPDTATNASFQPSADRAGSQSLPGGSVSEPSGSHLKGSVIRRGRWRLSWSESGRVL
jgi:hypothetical protein